MATLNVNQKFAAVQLVIQDSKGRPAQVDGVPVWASSDESQIAVTPAADGMSADVNAVAPTPEDGPQARITVTADADLGAGVVGLVGVSEDITVTTDPTAVASVMTLALGTPVDK